MITSIWRIAINGAMSSTQTSQDPSKGYAVMLMHGAVLIIHDHSQRKGTRLFNNSEFLLP